jgi:hypothetical protein
MTTREFIFHPRKLENSLKTVLRAKIMTTAKCFSITDMVVNDDMTFTFKKSHKIRGVKLDDPNLHSGKYEIEPIDEENSKLIVTIIQ